jgi:iron complex transport system substrate-binding protein
MRALLLFVGLLPLLSGISDATDRIVTSGSAITEIVFALGCGDRIVGVDTSSVFPEATASLPKIGYSRQLSAEGLLSLNPSLVIASEDAGPQSVIDQVAAAGIRVERVVAGHTIESAEARILAIASILEVPEKGQALVATMRQQIADAGHSKANPKPKVLFIYARAGGTLNASGQNTGAAAMIALAGAENAVHGYEGYKPLTAESALNASPDIILMTSRGLADMGGVDGLLTHPGLLHTPAGRDRRIIAMDDILLLGFGPRLGEAIRELRRSIHGTAPQVSAKLP